MSPEAIIDGLFAGSVYALVALALAIVFQPTRIMNFAQGEALILGAAVSYQIVALLKMNWALALVVTIAVAALMGVLMERMIMLPVRISGSRYAWIIATLAAALIFQSLFNLGYVDVDALRPDPVIAGGFEIAGVSVEWQELLTIVVALAVMAGYDVFLRRSTYGRAIRATAHSSDTSVLMGIPVQRIIVLSFVIAAVITAVAGLLAAPVIFIAPAVGLTFTIKGFTAAVIGGVGSPRGALIGGMIVGLLDTVVRSVVGGTVGNFAVFAALAVILIVFPSGLFGKPMEAH
ncbi:branched-chain amino acid ABC transporter permease [Sphaerisporangium siamense]|uniref:Branched-chain amino acid transport system permease protein n=1 Tax=Sphaerisporangium siamense TaxID=795645 RepID=A0A7W7GDF5_9ACTN|nr:branched-chain amino acid ABC transporter permease [Sphaerisporangium siamense]MBB4704499.1 branched-chain amino acid transport system permease protein [Sphaerisporangium siamense]GII86110.1 branched-chain amino acid ABC transporter permease [Sphaerisporangium siamense]